MYLVEAGDPSSNFDSIPVAMWWAVVTLTTVGYGDAVPITTAGKILGGTIALAGVALIAVPAGILGSGFFEEFERKRDAKQNNVPPKRPDISIADETEKFGRLRDKGLLQRTNSTNRRRGCSKGHRDIEESCLGALSFTC